MKNKLGFFTKIKNSIFNIKSYPNLISESFSRTLSYILILSLIVGGIIGVSQFTLLNIIEKESKKILQEEKYNFEINKGTLMFENSPYKQEEGNSIIIIDSNKSLNDKEALRSSTIHKDLSIVILKDGIIARNYGEQYEMKYSDIPFLPENINNEIILDSINMLAPVKYISFVVSILLVYIKALICAVLVSLAGVIISRMQSVKIKYIEILKLSMYAITLPMLIQLLLPIGAMTIIISSLYVILAINNIKNSKEQGITE